MRVCVLLLCVCCVCWRSGAQDTTYLISAPLWLHVDALETVLLQLFGFSEEVRVYVFLKTSMAPDHLVLARDMVTLNAQNHYQATAALRIFPSQLDKSVDHVILHVQSAQINKHLSLPVSRSNGFLWVQTDKPLYTPQQSVKVRAFSLNQELHPANRSVFLTFKDPDHQTVDVVEMLDLNNGIPSMQNPFKIPIRPKLGLWSIEASYSHDFGTKASTDFEIREYVLPSFSIVVQPEVYYISFGNFQNFCFRVSARYIHGAPVAQAEVFLRFGFISKKELPVIVPNSVTRETLSSSGHLDMCVNMEKVLSKHDGPKDLPSLFGKFLYIAVLLQEHSGGISQEEEFSAVKFVKSPYSLSLVSTPLFIKPGLPYNIQVLVKDHLDKPVNHVPVRLVAQQVFSREQDLNIKICPDHTQSGSDGLAIFVCNTPKEGIKVSLRFETEDPALPATSQASLSLEAMAYNSPNRRYLYIDPPLSGQSLHVGRYANIKVYSSTPSYVPVKALSFLVLSKGKVVHYSSQKFVASGDHRQSLNFAVTSAMVPSIRLLVYYILHGEGTSELVADSVWLEVRDTCVSGLTTELSYGGRDHKPKENLQLDIKTNQQGLVALSAVDSALFNLYPNYRDPVTMALRHIEQSDLGCGGGGGKDAADVFRMAGLTFMTNANAQPSTGGGKCTAAVRPTRALTEEMKRKKAKSFGPLKVCCEEGMQYFPRSVTCRHFAQERFKRVAHNSRCQQIFTHCCEYNLQHLDLDQNLILGRHDMGADLNAVPFLVRSFFPESWLWEVHPTRGRQQSLIRTLPDSLTTWELKAIGMFKNGICVSKPVQVSVQLPVSVDVPLPYQVVRGEQLELSGSVYNQKKDDITYCVTLTAGPELCLLQSQPAVSGVGFHSTACTWEELPAGGVGKVAFTLMGLKAGEHKLTFTLKTRQGESDIVEKTLRVVPEGVKMESYSGGILDPQGLYGSEKTTVVLKNQPPANMVPNTAAERMVTINGEIMGDVLSVVLDHDGLQHLFSLPSGSLEAELGRILPLAHLYQYLETTSKWDVMGGNIHKNSDNLRQKMKEGLISISSFRHGDSSYSMWTKRDASTWLTAAVVHTLATIDPVITVDRQALSESLSWLIRNAQNQDGSFSDKSSFRPNSVMAEGAEPRERSVYLTSFVLIALHRATRIRERVLQLRFHDDSMRSAADYISQHALNLKSVYVRAIATYAHNLHDPNAAMSLTLIDSLENLAQQKGHPAMLRYWQEENVASDWLKPDQSSGLTVETTAYALLTVLLKGRIQYANPIVSWLTQDQHYGQGFYSVQDTALTLEALTKYSKVIPRAVLNLDINVSYRRKGVLTRVQLSPSRPVATPIQVLKDDDITVSTGYGRGVSHVKMKTVYYQTTPPSRNCNFDISIEMFGADVSDSASMRAPHLAACAKYKPRPNELLTESTMTVMKIQLPTGVEAHLEDLRPFRDSMEPIISHYELQGNTVIIQMDSVPSDIFLCVGFRIRTRFKVDGASKSLLSVFEPQDKGSLCSKHFSYQEQKLQRLCVADQCQCMTAACAAYRGTFDLSLTAAKRQEETCRHHIKYAYKVAVTSLDAEGDFVAFNATVVEVLKNTDKDFEAVSVGTEVELIKKVTCGSVDVQNHKRYLVMGSSGSQVKLGHATKYRLPLDSDATVEPWPSDCATPDCVEHLTQLDTYALDLQLFSCPSE
ncbi:complement C5 isoform X2 [Entelurus aequoreus]|uniref:complement C5 isoform X1 n=1 Tax=Entelurus aequoreus TaxID=161455 RepID=UPI002B1E2244|nr:complement C5 isoform X1 [Entelurus aequoreus]XP_061881271.1 complement C5 isoform X2 [Entelurus aequoreus]